MNENTEKKVRLTLRQISEQAVPSTPDMWTNIENRLAQKNAATDQTQKQPANRRNVWKLANIAIVLALLIAAVVWLIRPQQSISAAEILLNAIQAQQSGNLGVKSYQGVIRKQLDNGATQTEEHVWGAVPAKHRIEVYMKPTPERVHQQIDPSFVLSTPLDNTLALTRIDIVDSLNHYWYSTELHGALRIAIYPFDSLYSGMMGGINGDGIGIFGTLWISRNPANLESLMEAMNIYFPDIKLVGTEIVAGRSTHVLKFNRRRTTSSTHQPFDITMWIDQESYLMLGERWSEPDGTLFQEWHFTSIELNPTLDEKIFSFEPSTKVLVLHPYLELYTQLSDHTTQFDPANLLTQDKFAQLVQDVKAQVDYNVLLPDTYTALPGLMPSPPIYDASQDVLTLKYQAVNNGMALVIMQGQPEVMKWFNPCTRDTDLDCESVSIGGSSGHYVETVETSAVNIQIGASFGWGDVQEAQVRWLGFEKEGTYILIRAEYAPKHRNHQVSKDEMLTVAAGLQEVK